MERGLAGFLVGLVFIGIGVSLSLYQFISSIGCTAQTKGKISVFRQKFMGFEKLTMKLTYTINGVKYDKTIRGDYNRSGKKPTYEGLDVERVGGVVVNVFYSPSNPKLHYISDEK